jgi:hypothetical protein
LFHGIDYSFPYIYIPLGIRHLFLPKGIKSMPNNHRITQFR